MELMDGASVDYKSHGVCPFPRYLDRTQFQRNIDVQAKGDRRVESLFKFGRTIFGVIVLCRIWINDSIAMGTHDCARGGSQPNRSERIVKVRLINGNNTYIKVAIVAIMNLMSLLSLTCSSVRL